MSLERCTYPLIRCSADLLALIDPYCIGIRCPSLYCCQLISSIFSSIRLHVRTFLFMLFFFKWSYSVSRARKHYSSFYSKFKNTTDTIDWSMCLSYYFFVSPCSSDTIRSFYGQISICGKPSMASLFKHQFFFGYRRYLFILRDIDHISDPYLHFSGLVWYEKLWERVYYSISNSFISNDRRVPHAGSSTILCSSRKRANPYVVRS